MNKNDILNNSNYQNAPTANMNQSPFVKLSLESEDFSKMNMFNNNQNNRPQNNSPVVSNNYNNKVSQPVSNVVQSEPQKNINNDEIEEMTNRTKNLMIGLKVKEKRVEIVTKITYTYEDGSTREVVQTQKHSFK